MNVSEVRAALMEAVETADALGRRFNELLAQLDGGETVQVPRQGVWTREMVHRLWREVEHLPGVRALFELTAQRANQPVRFSELVEHSGLPAKQQSNEHARLSRVSTDLFGQKKWPIQNWQGPPAASGQPAEMVYRMGGTVAAWWREIAKVEAA